MGTRDIDGNLGTERMRRTGSFIARRSVLVVDHYSVSQSSPVNVSLCS
jgi:hypothetical protein